MHRTSSSAGTDSLWRGDPPRRKLYFVRHGETDWNAERRLQGQRDVPLNALGRKQAARCGELLRDLLAAGGATPQQFAFTSSPLSRARETMEILRTGLGVAPEDYITDARLAELSFGRWEGLTYKEVRALDRSVLATRERDKWNFQPPGGGGYGQLLVRGGRWAHGVSRGGARAGHCAGRRVR